MVEADKNTKPPIKRKCDVMMMLSHSL